jgi:hypothetical protein
MKPLRACAVFFVVTLCWTAHVQGQGITGSITGVIRDPGGGVVPGVEVVVVHTGTNAVYRSLSNDIGVYAIRALPIGRYDLTGELAGFKRFAVGGIRVQVDEIVRVDIHLQMGEVTESVQVTAGTIGVDTQSSTLKTVVDQRRVEELPLDGRDPVALMRLVAGVVPTSGHVSGTTYPGVVAVSVSGSRGNMTNYLLDGGQNNDHYRNSPNPMPNPDALAEFSVQTSNFSAEHGRNMGAVVNAVTKSGTNQIHGSAFGYLRNSALNAAHFFAGPKPGDPSKKQDDGLKRSQFGATVGGPVWLGNLYDGRDRTFFFFSYQGTRFRRTPTTRFVNTFTAAERQGDFSALARQLINPFTGEAYPNNRIPSNEHNPVARYTLDNLMALPEPGAGGQISFTRRDDRDDDQILVKMDHNLTSNNVLSVRYYRSLAEDPGFLDPKNLYNQAYRNQWLNTSVVVRDTHTFGPSLINESLFSFNRTDGTHSQNPYPKSFADMGVQGIAQDSFPQIYFSIQGLSGINTGETETFERDEYQVANTLRWTKGTHQLSMGGEFAYGVGDITGSFYANGRFWFENAAGWTGHAPADFLIGKFSRWSQGLGEFKGTRLRRPNLFVQDSMRLSPRLSVDLGLRWEPFVPYHDSLGKLALWAPGRQSTRFVNAPEGILYPGDPGVPRGGHDTSWTNFAPRIGFAYDLTGDGKTALRMGYGIFYDFHNTVHTNSLAGQGPFGTRVDYYGNAFNSLSDPWGGFPGGNPLPVVGFSAVGTEALDPPADVAFVFPHNAQVYVPDMRGGYMQSWNLTLERQLGEMMVRTAYVGTKGTALLSTRQLNAPLPDPAASTATTNQRRPLFPNYGSVVATEAVQNSNYHGIQFTVERRFARGYSILANYTRSKVEDEGGNANPVDRSFDRGLADFDRTHVFNFSGMWETPIRFDNQILHGVLGGWTATSIVNLYSGNVFTVFSGVDNARTGQGGQRADLVGDPYAAGDNRSRGELILQYLDRAAFAPNALGTYGDLGRNTFRGPGYANVDLGLHKRFSITEGLTTQFRFEMFNAFNRVNLNAPTATITSGNFMRITGAGSPRILQAALRFVW